MKIFRGFGFLLVLSLLFSSCGYNSLQLKEEQVFTS